MDAAAAVAQEAAQYTGPVDSSTYVPGPVDVGWQIYFGAAIGVFPFIIGSYEFGKRILIQRRYAPNSRANWYQGKAAG